MSEQDGELLALGRAIRQVREQRGMSAADLAAAAGIDRKRLNAIEAGQFDPAYDVLLALANGLGVELPALVARTRHGRTQRGEESELDPRLMSAAFGRRLSELRAARGISQHNIARETGMHPTAIRRYERGLREPRLTSILLLARGLKVAPGELLDTLGAEEWHDIDSHEGGKA